MEDLAKAIVAALFVGLIVLTIVIFSLGLATPTKKKPVEVVQPIYSTSTVNVIVYQTTTVPAATPTPEPTPAPIVIPAPVYTPPPTPTPAPLPLPPPPVTLPVKPTYALTAIGTNSVNSKTGEVVMVDGTPVDTTAEPGSAKAPAVTNPIKKEDFPKGAIVLDISAENGIQPPRFSVHRGEAITIVVESVDQYTHVFRFNDPRLNGVAVGVGGMEARAVAFNAPTVVTTTLSYFCDVPGHAGRGETGLMEVQ